MRADLQAIADEFASALIRLHDLRERVAADRWGVRPAPERWSAAECVAHLNLTSAAFVPLLRAGLEHARVSGLPVRARYRRDPVGWLLWKVSGPPVRYGRTRTTAPFVPRGDREPAELVAEFERLQETQLALVREGEGLPIDRVKVASPFDSRVHYTVYSALTILPRHQHRHLWQAEAAVALAKAGSPP